MLTSPSQVHPPSLSLLIASFHGLPFHTIHLSIYYSIYPSIYLSTSIYSSIYLFFCSGTCKDREIMRKDPHKLVEVCVCVCATTYACIHLSLPSMMLLLLLLIHRSLSTLLSACVHTYLTGMLDRGLRYACQSRVHLYPRYPPMHSHSISTGDACMHVCGCYAVWMDGWMDGLCYSLPPTLHHHEASICLAIHFYHHHHIQGSTSTRPWCCRKPSMRPIRSVSYSCYH